MKEKPENTLLVTQGSFPLIREGDRTVRSVRVAAILSKKRDFMGLSEILGSLLFSANNALV